MDNLFSFIKKAGTVYLKFIGIVLTIFLFFSLIKCGKSSGGTYVEGFIDRRGHYHKGHFRKDYSTDPNAIKHRNASRKYYHTKGKYLR